MTADLASAALGQVRTLRDPELPEHVVPLPIERLLEILGRSPATISQAEARRLAKEAPPEKLLALLGSPNDAVVAQTVLILAHRGSDDAFEGLVKLAHDTRLPAIREVAVRSLARCGEEGRRRLLELSHRSPMVDHALKGLREAALIPSFRPAALARLTEMAGDARLSDDARFDAAAAVLRNGWACGVDVVREVVGRRGASPLVDVWELQGYPASPQDVLSDALGTFVLDYEAWLMRARAEREVARTTAFERFTQGLRVEAQGRSASAPAPTPPSERVGRNDPCPCGSGKKYKKCCAGASSGRGEASLASAVLAFPAGLYGFRVSPFDRPAEEQARLARIFVAADPGVLPDHVYGEPYVAWAAVNRLLVLRAQARAYRLTFEILRDWRDEDGALDVVEIAQLLVELACQVQPDDIEAALDLALPHIPSWGVHGLALALVKTGRDIGRMLPALLAQRRGDPVALLGWIAAYGQHGALAAGAHGPQLRELDSILAGLGPSEYITQARQRLHRALVAAEPSEAARAEARPPGGNGTRALPSLGEAVNMEEVTRALSSRVRRATLQEGALEPAEPLEEAARAPFELERACRERALVTEGEYGALVEAEVSERLETSLARREGEVGVCLSKDFVAWVLPRGEDLQQASAVAYAAGLFQERHGAEGCALLTWGGHRVIRQDFRGDDFSSTEHDACAALIDAFTALGLPVPEMFSVPHVLFDWLSPEPSAWPVVADHPLASEAAQAGVSVLEAAHRRGLEGRPWPA